MIRTDVKLPRVRVKVEWGVEEEQRCKCRLREKTAGSVRVESVYLCFKESERDKEGNRGRDQQCHKDCNTGERIRIGKEDT